MIARGMGTPCVCGVEAFHIDAKAKEVRIDGSDVVLHEGDLISIDGGEGTVVLRSHASHARRADRQPQTVLGWADEIRLQEGGSHPYHVRVNADNPDDAALALDFGLRRSVFAARSICSSVSARTSSKRIS